MHEKGLAVSLKSDILFHIGSFPVTNTFTASLLLSVLMILFVVFVVKKSDLRPSKLQLVTEFFIAGGYDFTKETLKNDKLAARVYPLIASLFFVILFFNLTKFLPGMESIKFNGEDFFKPVHSDLNMTLALGIVAWIVVQFVGAYILGVWKYGSKFINFKKPLTIPLGLLEIVSEVAKMISLSFRLFVNILVGGILIMLLQQLTHYMLPVVAMLFEVFVAFLQAGVFALLTLFYIKLATDKPH